MFQQNVELKQPHSTRIQIRPPWQEATQQSIRTAEVTISIALDSYRRPGDPIVKNNVYGVSAEGIECSAHGSSLRHPHRADSRKQFIFSNRHKERGFRGQEHRRFADTASWSLHNGDRANLTESHNTCDRFFTKRELCEHCV